MIMFDFLFNRKKDLSHNSKKVRRWQAEHKALATHAVKTVYYYENNELKKAKKQLLKLQSVALNHLMDEDVTFTELFKKAEKSHTDQTILEAIKEFRKSFIDTKKVLIHFFIHYTDPRVELDSTFIEKLKGIIDALVQRIEFEEQNLYVMINK